MNKTTPEDRRWAKQQAVAIERRLREIWGKHADAVLHPDVMRALFEARVLHLILDQAMEEYAPAQRLAWLVVNESPRWGKEER